MKHKVDVNLELGLLEYELQQAEKPMPERAQPPEWINTGEYNAPAPAARRADAAKDLH
jgi:hypothetical protein